MSKRIFLIVIVAGCFAFGGLGAWLLPDFAVAFALYTCASVIWSVFAFTGDLNETDLADPRRAYLEVLGRAVNVARHSFATEADYEKAVLLTASDERSRRAQGVFHELGSPRHCDGIEDGAVEYTLYRPAGSPAVTSTWPAAVAAWRFQSGRWVIESVLASPEQEARTLQSSELDGSSQRHTPSERVLRSADFLYTQAKK